MEIVRCTKDDYSELLDVFNDSFEYGRESNWFQRFMTHCTPGPDIANTEEVGHHLVCKLDGNIVGGLGVYPFDWDVVTSDGNPFTVKGYKIGQVSCLKQYRGRGVMSALMKKAAEDMWEQNRFLGYLNGDKSRYKHFGYGFGGETLVFSINRRLLEERTKGVEVSVKQVIDDITDINAAYETLPSRAQRSEHYWKRQLLREDVVWYTGESKHGKAYLALQGKDNVCEIYGEENTAAAILLWLFDKGNDVKSLNVKYPYNTAKTSDTHRMAHMLSYISGHVTLRPLGLMCGIKGVVVPGFASPAIYEKEEFFGAMCAWISEADNA